MASTLNIPTQVSWPSAFLVLALYTSIIGGWIFGVAVAKGFWLTVGAIFLPPMAWVLFAQWILERLA